MAENLGDLVIFMKLGLKCRQPSYLDLFRSNFLKLGQIDQKI